MQSSLWFRINENVGNMQLYSKLTFSDYADKMMQR